MAYKKTKRKRISVDLTPHPEVVKALKKRTRRKRVSTVVVEVLKEGLEK